MATKEGFDELQKEVLEYAINNFSDENGFGIAINDKDSKTLKLLKDNDFLKNEQPEN